MSESKHCRVSRCFAPDNNEDEDLLHLAYMAADEKAGKFCVLVCDAETIQDGWEMAVMALANTEMNTRHTRCVFLGYAV